MHLDVHTFSLTHTNAYSGFGGHIRGSGAAVMALGSLMSCVFITHPDKTAQHTIIQHYNHHPSYLHGEGGWRKDVCVLFWGRREYYDGRFVIWIRHCGAVLLLHSVTGVGLAIYLNKPGPSLLIITEQSFQYIVKLSHYCCCCCFLLFIF